MKRLRNSISATAAALILALAFSAPAANAYSSGQWKVQPYGCDPGWFKGSSAWRSDGVAEANTNEFGNWCWFGNAKVSVAIHDQYSQVKGSYVFGANSVWAYYRTPLVYGYGGFHSWGSSTQGQRT
jgi:hypothetical protein